MTTKISYAIAFLLGFGMVFLGSRFFGLPKQQQPGTVSVLMHREIIHFIISKGSGIYFPAWSFVLSSC